MSRPNQGTGRESKSGRGSTHWLLLALVATSAGSGCTESSSGDAASAPAELTGVIGVSAGREHTCAVKNSGVVVCWGDNRHGQLGNGTMNELPDGGFWTNPQTPVPVAGLTDAVEVASGRYHSCARHVNGSVSCWGENEDGQLGDGTRNQRLTPVVVMGLGDAAEIAAGERHSCARRVDSSVVCWGHNGVRQLGDGSAIILSASPVKVMGIANAVQISTAGVHTCAVVGDGTVWCWGSNVAGRLGNGTDAVAVTAVQVGGLSDAVEVRAGGGHSCARRTAGTVVCWGGGNHNGELGDVTVNERYAHVAVVGVTDAVELAASHYQQGAAHSCARRRGGSVACWGAGGIVLGAGYQPKSANLALPVVGLSDASKISAGAVHTCAVRSTSGVACWGEGLMGVLGNGAGKDFDTPTPVLDSLSPP